MDVKRGNRSTSTPEAERLTPDEIVNTYQVKSDTRTEYLPSPEILSGIFLNKESMTQTESDLLKTLQFQKGAVGLSEFEDTVKEARSVSHDYYKPDDNEAIGLVHPKGGEDGHQDAFRHAYWNALMTQRFGEDFAKSFATAHEGVPNNPATREAMDLHNNEVGRQIALAHPDATDEELAKLVGEAVKNGKMVVIDRNDDLVYSDKESVGMTGTAVLSVPREDVTTEVPEYAYPAAPSPD